MKLRDLLRVAAILAAITGAFSCAAADPDRFGIFISTLDGRERRRIPLPKGYFDTMPAHFPGEGSGNGARIIVSAEKYPLL